MCSAVAAVSRRKNVTNKRLLSLHPPPWLIHGTSTLPNVFLIEDRPRRSQRSIVEFSGSSDTND